MIGIPGYQLLEKIYESSNSLVYRALRDADDLPVIIKTLQQEYPSPQELIRYQQEYEMAVNAEKMHDALWDIKQLIRAKLKYKSDGLTDIELKQWVVMQDEFYCILDNHNLKLD